MIRCSNRSFAKVGPTSANIACECTTTPTLAQSCTCDRNQMPITQSICNVGPMIFAIWARVCNHVTDFNARNKCLTAKLLQQGYRYHKLRKTFSKFYRRHYELISKYNVGLKTLLSEGLSEPEFYGDLVYKFKKLKGINDFSFQFRKIITRYKRIGYNLNVMRQSACLVFNPIMVDNYAAFFNCTPVGRASDSMMAPT